jgi:DNA-binding NarL/FixJ family response regulator
MGEISLETMVNNLRDVIMNSLLPRIIRLEKEVRKLKKQLHRKKRLTPRQRQVAELVKRGWTYQRIARELGCTVSNVQQIVLRIDRKGYDWNRN